MFPNAVLDGEAMFQRIPKLCRVSDVRDSRANLRINGGTHPSNDHRVDGSPSRKIRVWSWFLYCTIQKPYFLFCLEWVPKLSCPFWVVITFKNHRCDKCTRVIRGMKRKRKIRGLIFSSRGKGGRRSSRGSSHVLKWTRVCKRKSVCRADRKKI